MKQLLGDAHRAAIAEEARLQLRPGLSPDAYAASKFRQMDHQHAAHNADAVYAKLTGFEVVYSHADKPIFYKGS